MTPQELQEENPVLGEDALTAMQNMTFWKCPDCGDKGLLDYNNISKVSYCLMHQK